MSDELMKFADALLDLEVAARDVVSPASGSTTEGDKDRGYVRVNYDDFQILREAVIRARKVLEA